MKFKSHILTQASGSVGGTTYATNRSGLYMRARAIPTNPGTALQTIVRNAFSTLTTRWGTLTDTQRANWAIYANNVPWKNTLGDSIKLTGPTMYVGSNTPRIQAGDSIIDNAPTSFTVPAIASPDLYQDVLTPFAVNFALDTGGLDPTDLIYLYASTAKSPTINYFKGPYQFNSKGNGTTPIMALLPNPTWTIGQKMFLRAQISYADGRLSPSWTGSLILAHTPV